MDIKALLLAGQLIIEKHSETAIWFERYIEDEDGLPDIERVKIEKTDLVTLMFEAGKTVEDIKAFFRHEILTDQARAEDDEHDYQPLGDARTAAYIENMMLQSLICDEDETGDTGLSF